MNFRERLDQATKYTGSDTAVEPTEDSFTSPFFAVDRVKNPVCLDLRLPDGVRKALPYTYFTEMNFDLDTGIEILTSQKRITITGRNLIKLFDYLIAYRVKYIQANIGGDTTEDGLFVKEILVQELVL